MSENEEKKQSPIEKWYNSLDEDQKAAHQAKLAKARKEKAEIRKEMKAKAQKEAEEMVPMMLAEQIKNEIDGRNFKPSVETLEKLRSIVDKGMTVKEIRKKYFAGIEPTVWDKIVKMLFRDQVANAEQLGIQVLNSQQAHMKVLEKQLRSLKSEKRRLKKEKQTIPPAMFSMENKLSEQIFQLQIDVNQAMLSLGVVGEKQKAGGVNVNVNFARPAPAEKEVVVDVSPAEAKE